jgi:hypothetical protein
MTGGVSEKRAWPRLNLYLPLIVTPCGSEGERREETTFTINISSSGVLFLSRSLYAPGTPLRMAITVPQDGRCRSAPVIVHCEGEVVRIERFRMDGFSIQDKRFGVAARFRNGFKISMEEIAGGFTHVQGGGR